MVTGALDILNEYECLFPTKIHSERLIFKGFAQHRDNVSKTKVATPITPIRNDLKNCKNGVYRLDPLEPEQPSNLPDPTPAPKPKKSKKEPKIEISEAPSHIPQN